MFKRVLIIICLFFLLVIVIASFVRYGEVQKGKGDIPPTIAQRLKQMNNPPTPTITRFPIDEQTAANNQPEATPTPTHQSPGGIHISLPLPTIKLPKVVKEVF